MIKSKSILRVTLSLGLVSYLVACNSIKLLSTSPINNVYCDNFLIYEMCAEDTDNDGIVEHVYFADSSEVFLYRQGAKESIPDRLATHRCVRAMDEELVATTNRVFGVTDETTFLEKQDIRGAMMIKYFAYLPEITACNLRAEQKENN